MKLKIFNRFLIPALIVGAMGTFSSCKDTTEDYWNDIQNQIGNASDKTAIDLDKLEQKLTKELKDVADSLEATKGQLTVDLSNLQNQVENYVTYDTLHQAINPLFQAIASVKTRIETNENAIKNINELLGDGVNGDSTTLAKRLVGMEEQLARLNDSEYGLDALHALATKASQQAYEDSVNIAKIEETLNNYNIPARIQELDSLKKELSNYKAQTDKALDSIWNAINPALNETIENVDTLKNQMSSAISRIDGLEVDVKTAKENIEKLSNRLFALTGWTKDISNRISSMFIEAVESPILGYLKTPLGIQGNILFNWFGQSLNDVQFPQFTATGDCYGMEPEDYDGDYMYVDPKFYEEGYFKNGIETIEANKYFMADNTLGSVYVSVNPIGIDMEGKDFNLFSAKGLYNALAITDVKPYYGDLNFGYSRATTSTNYSNGLYEVTTSLKTLDKATIDELHFDLEPGMKSELKDLLKDRNLSSLAGFANLVYNQFKANGDCALPALAVNAKWSETDADGKNLNYSVNTSYSLAAATVRPLSFATIPADADFSKYLRNLPNLDEFLNDLQFDLEGKFKIELNPITINVEDYKIELTAPTITISSDEIIAEFDIPENIRIVDGEIVYDTTHEVIKGESIGWIADNIQSSLEDFTSGANQDFNNVIDQMVTDITKQINDMLTSITDQVDDSVIALQDEINGKIENITSKIKNYYSKIERVYDRVKGYLSHPSDYMQVTMLYNAANGIHRVSSSKVAPSYINAGKIILMPTTYNAEILTPTYKKFVAVSNVYVSDNYAVNATNNSDCKNLMKEANQSEYMNQVISGERRTVALNANNLKAGYTYEILYQALDFRGKISTQKFYINIR